MTAHLTDEQLIRKPRVWTEGKESTGADTFTSGNLIITRHKTAGVQLWRGKGLDRVPVSLGFTSVDGAKAYVERVQL